MAIGLTGLPSALRNNAALSASQLEQLASVPSIPKVNPDFVHRGLFYAIENLDTPELEAELYSIAGHLLNQEKVADAWQVLLRLP